MFIIYSLLAIYILASVWWFFGALRYATVPYTVKNVVMLFLGSFTDVLACVLVFLSALFLEIGDFLAKFVDYGDR